MPIALVIIFFILLQVPAFQRVATEKITTFLSNKIKTKVTLRDVNIAFPKSIQIRGFYVEDQKKDTLLYIGNLVCNIELTGLFSKQIIFKEIALENASGHLKSMPGDSTFNFNFIIRAFSRTRAKVDTFEKKKVGEPWQIGIKAISLSKIYFTINDKRSGLDAKVKLGKFSTHFKYFDVSKNKILVNELVLENTEFKITQNTPLLKKYKEPNKKSRAFITEVDLIRFKNVKGTYINTTNDQVAKIELNELEVNPTEIDLVNHTIALKSVKLFKTDASFTMNRIKNAEIKNEEIVVVTPLPNWKLTAKTLVVSQCNFGFNNNTFSQKENVVDYNHLLLTDFILNASDIKASADFASLNLKNLAFKEQCGFRIKTFSGTLTYDSLHMSVTNMHLQTNNSKLDNELGIRYKSVKNIGVKLGELEVIAALHKSHVAVSDVFFFAPVLKNIRALNLNPADNYLINTDITGALNNLLINEFNLSSAKQTHISFKGKLKNVLDPNKLFIDLSLLKIQSTKKELFSVISKKLIPVSINLPDAFELEGTVKGYIKNFTADIELNSTFGSAVANIAMNPATGNVLQPYVGSVSLRDFDIGALINKNDVIGKVTMLSTFNGSGVTAKDINTEINIEIDKVFFKGYEYSSFLASGLIVKNSFTGKASMNDKNLAFNFNGKISVDSVSPEYVFDLELKGADLKALHFTEADTRLSTNISSDIRHIGKNFIGTASIKNTLLIENNKKFPIDSIVLRSSVSNGVSEITLRSEIVDADMKGEIVLQEFPTILKQHISTYFDFHFPLQTKTVSPQHFNFAVNLKDPSLIVQNLIPNLLQLSPSFAKGSYDSENRKIDVTASMPFLNYNNIKADSLKIGITSDIGSLKYAVTLAEISNPTLKTENASLRGELKNNELIFNLSTAKDDSLKLVVLSGILKSNNNAFQLHINEALILNQQKWNVDVTNEILFAHGGLIAKSMGIKNEKQLVLLNSSENEPGSPLHFNFEHFDLATISKLIENKKELVRGEMNGIITLETKNKNTAFTSDLIIQDLVFQSVPIGTLKIEADNKENSSVYNLNIGLKGNKNDLALNGTYSALKDAANLDLSLLINHFNLKTVEPFTFGQISRTSGDLKGNVKIGGSLKFPLLDGDLFLNECAFNPKFVDTYLKVPQSKISFVNNKITFSDFTLVDSLNQKAVINGNIYAKALNDIDLNLRVTSNNFLALNTTKNENPLYFGTIFLDSDISIKGKAVAPVVKVKAKLNKGSTLTYIKPEREIGKAENKGVVEFADSLTASQKIMVRQNDTSNAVVMVKGIDLDASITFDKSVRLKMLVDEQSGDSLFIVGGGTLNFILDRSGKTNLTGKYMIDDGGYHLSLSDVVKRDFRIEKGSTVSWSGDMLDAYVDIRAIYTIKTSPIDLIQNDLAGVDDFERNKYRNMLTFYVYLKMNGFISAPEISFDIQLAPKDKGAVNGTVNAKLEELRGDETQLNKQVFALLTLRRFISDNPLDNGGGGGGLSSTSRTSASKVLTQQLSTLSQKYIKVIDLDLGVNSFEDYSTGQEEGRTQLQVGISKQLFRDKVTVRVGGNIELEGERAKQNNASDVAGNISVDYKLTEDGRYKLRGFRQNQYENPIEGEIIKTGVGVVYVRNYNKVKELFKKPNRSVIPKVEKIK